MINSLPVATRVLSALEYAWVDPAKFLVAYLRLLPKRELFPFNLTSKYLPNFSRWGTHSF